MRASSRPRLEPGDWMIVSGGLYAGMGGRVAEVRVLAGDALLARLELPIGDEWVPCWDGPMTEHEWLTDRDTTALERALLSELPPPSDRKWLLDRAACLRLH